MNKEKWSEGKATGCVVSDTPNRHKSDAFTMDYYGGHLVAESIPNDGFVNLIAAAPDLLAALIENHEWHLNYDDTGTYEGSGLWDTNRAAIAKAKGATQ